MTVSRRRMIQGLGSLPLAPSVSTAASSVLFGTTQSLRVGKVSLPDKASFTVDGTHLDAAYTHPLGARALAAAQDYLQTRVRESNRHWPEQNSRDAAVALFAQLINAQPGDIAVVPSTMEGENLIADALGLGPGVGVVTDPFHYNASLVMYGERHKQGMPLAIVAPRGNRIDYSDLDAAITRETKLVAVSLVSTHTGYEHDLKMVCDIAHRKGALVHADIIQAAGAIPLDVKASGVDFCCAGTYKWLMGDFGVAFLYVRPDRLPQLRRVQIGWRQIKAHSKHFLPFDPPGPLAGDWQLGTDTAGVFEVGTPNWAALATVVGSLSYINDVGIDAIIRHRRPLLRRLHEQLPRLGFGPLTPPDCQGPYVVFSYENARDRFGEALHEAKVYVTLGKHDIRISVSVYNDMQDIDRLLSILALRSRK